MSWSGLPRATRGVGGVVLLPCTQNLVQHPDSGIRFNQMQELIRSGLTEARQAMAARDESEKTLDFTKRDKAQVGACARTWAFGGGGGGI